MNLHMPQDPESEAELKNLAAVPYQIISPANNASIIGIYQDSMLGSYLFSKEGVKFNPRQAMNLLMMFNGVNEEQLLKDVWDFAKNPPQHEQGKEKPFYCLQPIVVKKRNETEWEVIDGQQRLTTIYLILKNLENQIERDQKNFSKIFYSI